MAELWAKHGARVLNDDRVVIGVHDDQVQISGTPWHGTAGLALPLTVPLRRIYFLRHAEAISTHELSPIETAAQLVSLSVIPYWDSQSAQNAVDTAAGIVQLLSGTRLDFVPDLSVVEYIRHAIDSD